MTTAQLRARGLTKHPGGRPPVKSPETCQKLLEVVRTGLPLKFAAASIGVTYDALNRWRERDHKFAEELELARLASVKARWDIIQAAARGDDSPGDWHAAAWSEERTWPADFGKPETQLNIQNNVGATNIHNEFTINVAMAENIGSRVRDIAAETDQLFARARPALKNDEYTRPQDGEAG